jgi:hypothetical protein
MRPRRLSGASGRPLNFTVLEGAGQGIVEIKRGRCHCGPVEFEVEFHNGFEKLRRCNCSLCRRKGAVMASVAIDRLRVTKGQDKLSLYQWNTRTAKHYFCSVCGIYTHHQRRSAPGEFGFNVACIDGVDPFAFGEVPIGDGASASLV